MAGTFFKDQALALQSAGHHVDVAFVEHRSLRQIDWRHLSESHFQVTSTREDGLFTLRQKGWNTFLQTVPGALIWARLTQRLVAAYVDKYGMPQILHAHNALWAGYAASLISRRRGIPYVITEHSSAFLLGEISPDLAEFVAKAYAGASHVVAVSSSLARSMQTHMGNRQAIVIPNVVDAEFFSPAPAAPPPIPFRFLAIGNLVENKGFDILIRAFAACSGGRESTDELYIVGDGPQRRSLESLTDCLGIRSRVHFSGYLSREGVREKMWTSHALVLPSLRETFGVVLIEALSVGLPVIATRSGGPEDIVTPEVGLLVKAGNSDEMAKAMAKMRLSHGFLTETARRQVLRKFSRREFALCHEKIFNAILLQGEDSPATSRGIL